MNGSSEMRQLAHLLRVGADAAREIGALRPRDAAELNQLADEAGGIADRLDGIAAGKVGCARPRE